MSSSEHPLKIPYKINVPTFTEMRITPPLMLQPINIQPLEFDYTQSQYEPFSKQIFQKIGLNFQSDNTFFNLINGIGCLSFNACKALSRDTLMEINSKDDLKVQQIAPQTRNEEVESEQTQDEQKKQKYEKMWKQVKKRQIKPSIIKFDVAYKKHHKLSEDEWKQKIKEYFC